MSLTLFFREEIFHWLSNLTFIPYILILGVISTSVFFASARIRNFVISLIKKLRYSHIKDNLVEHVRGFLIRIKEQEAEEMGKSLAKWLGNFIITHISFYFLSLVIFHHYPLKMLNILFIYMFSFTSIAYFFISLAFEKETLRRSIILYSSIPFAFYPFALISQYTGMNLFETLPIDVIDAFNINVYNITDIANKLFILTAPSCAITIVFIISSSIVVRRVCTSLLNKLKSALLLDIMLQLLD